MWNVGNRGPAAGEAARFVRDFLPPEWTVRSGTGTRAADLLVVAPDGRSSPLDVKKRAQVQPRDVADLLRRQRERDAPLLVLAPFLGPRTRELLTEGGVNYADATGNLRLVLNDPAVFIRTRGADRDPDRRPRTIRSLKGAAAGRVVRALCDFSPPYGVRALAEMSSTPPASVSRVIGLLDEEALLERDERRRVVAVDRAGLLRRWADDYDVGTSNRRVSCIEPRGLAVLTSKLGRLERHAVTGSLASDGVAPARLALLYVDDAAAAADALELEPTDVGANVWLLEPFDEVVFERTVEMSLRGTIVTAAARSQVAVDLLTSPGRGPQEGEVLVADIGSEASA